MKSDVNKSVNESFTLLWFRLLPLVGRVGRLHEQGDTGQAGEERMVSQSAISADLRRAIGQELRAYRRRADLSQLDLAQAVGYDRTYIAKVETGHYLPARSFWERVDVRVSASGELVARHDQVVQEALTREICERQQASRQADAAVEAFKRRPSVSSTQGECRKVYPDLFDFSSEDLPGTNHDVETIRATSNAFQTADRQVGGGKLYRSVVRYLNHEVAPCLLDIGRPNGTADYFSAAASLTEIAGWMAHDGGSNSKARRHFDQAYRLSSAAKNAALSANVCASMSHLAVQDDQLDDAIRIANAGLVRARNAKGAIRLRARLYAMRARAFAERGDEQDCITSIDAAEELLCVSDPGPDAEWIAGFDFGSLASESAICFQKMGRLKGAESFARKAISLREGDRVRSRAFAQLTLATVLVRSGRIDETAAVGSEVCGLVSSLNSARVLAGLTRLAHSVQNHHSTPEVRDFLEKWESVRVNDAPIEAVNRGWPV